MIRLYAEHRLLKHQLLNMYWTGGFLLVVGVFTAVAIVAWGVHGATDPVPRPELFRGRSALAAYAGAVLQDLSISVY